MKPNRIPHISLWLLVAASLLIGLVVLDDFGASWDEHLQYKQYAPHALDAYDTWFREGRAEGQWEGLEESSGVVKDFHGPSFVMSVELFTRLALRLNSTWQVTDLRHLVHFLAFQLAVISLYLICRRWLSAWASFGTTLLFMTQPVFWGHGFINPKDMPFTAFFLLSVALGFHAYDYLFSNRDNLPLVERVSAAWNGLPHRRKVTLVLLTVFWVVSMLVLFAGVDVIHTALVNLITEAYAQPKSLAGILLARVAEDAGSAPAEVYVQKAFLVFLRLRGVYTLLSLASLLWLYRRQFPDGLRLLGSPVLLAGFAVGFATSMRIAGPLAGLLVALYMLGRQGKKAVLPIVLYGALGVTVMYCTWPYLWAGPIERLVQGLQVMSSFPWRGKALFNGVYYAADQIPPAYLPTLLAVQMTEPVWVLFFAGLITAVTGFMKNRKYGGLLYLTIGWLVLPLAGLIFSSTSLYDNFRQVLFILPPAFLAAGAGLDWACERLHSAAWRSALVAVLSLPGIAACIYMHPYEYAYYNSFIGGPGGAFRRFESDYWTTSFREAAGLLAQVAEPNSKVQVVGPSHTFESFLRPDLKLVESGGDYVVITTRYNWDMENHAEAPDVMRVERLGAIYAVIRKICP